MRKDFEDCLRRGNFLPSSEVFQSAKVSGKTMGNPVKNTLANGIKLDHKEEKVLRDHFANTKEEGRPDKRSGG